MKSIMIATDGSEHAGEALDVAIELARDSGAKLVVLAVRPHVTAGRGGPGPAVLEVENQDGARHIAEAGAAAAAAAGVEATAHTAHGDVVDSICDASSAFQVDLVVVGTRSRGPISGTLLGSVSHALIKRSQIPVTIVGHGVAPAA